MGLKYAEVWTFAAMALSLTLLGLAIRTLPLGTANAVWTGVGPVRRALLGVLYFEESADLPRLLCILLILAGIAVLKHLSPH